MLGGDNAALLAPSSQVTDQQALDSTGMARPTQGPSNILIPPTPSFDAPPHSLPTDPAQRTIVIHPGSRMLRIGRASDPLPISVPNVVARRRQGAAGSSASGVFKNSEPSPETLETFNSKVGAIRIELRSRMRQIKLRGITNGQGIAANYNADVVSHVLSEDQDPLGTIWPPVADPEAKDLYIGEDALLIAEPEQHGYAIRWPINRGGLNTADDSGYESKNEIIADIEAVWLYALSSGLGIKEQELKVSYRLGCRLSSILL